MKATATLLLATVLLGIGAANTFANKAEAAAERVTETRMERICAQVPEACL